MYYSFIIIYYYKQTFFYTFTKRKQCFKKYIKKEIMVMNVSSYPDIRVLMQFGEVQHVVECQHSRWRLSEIHGRIHRILCT